MSSLKYFLICFLLAVNVNIAQEESQDKLRASEELVYQGNESYLENKLDVAESNYRDAISKNGENFTAKYNLSNAQFEGDFIDEAIYGYQNALKSAKTKEDKHHIFHNIGTALMKKEQCQEAVEAFKNALRNNPKDDETRYNLALAKDCASKQSGKDQDKDGEDEENKDEKENQDKKDNDKNEDKDGDNEDKKNEDKGDEEDKDNEGDKKDESNQGDKQEDKQQPKPREGKLSPQQIQSLLEAMNNEEQKVQKKMNLEKQKGKKVKTEKDW
jgi:Ca-activated chloride channel family protein